MPRTLLDALGVTQALRDWAAEVGVPDAHLGRVVRIDRGRASVRTDDGEVAADLPSDPLAIGDWILVRAHLDRILVAAVAERRTTLVRADPGRAARPQLLAANVDLALVLAPLDRLLRPGWIERALVLTHEAGVLPMVIGTKTDLVTDAAALGAELRSLAAGVEVLLTSTHSGEGLDALAGTVAAAGTVVLIGASGAGKSSLANALARADVAGTGDVRELDRRGRHTTTARSLHVLPEGGVLIDAPGIREIGIWETEEGVDRTFADVTALAAACRFADCSHEHEPGCAVQAALADGSLDPQRLRRWRGLVAEKQAVDSRAQRAERKTQSRRSTKDRRGRRAAERDAWQRRGREDE